MKNVKLIRRTITLLISIVLVLAFSAQIAAAQEGKDPLPVDGTLPAEDVPPLDASQISDTRPTQAQTVPPTTEIRQNIKLKLGERPVFSNGTTIEKEEPGNESVLNDPTGEMPPFPPEKPDSINGDSPDRSPGWNLIKGENFEGAFPNDWNLYDGDGSTNGEYYWGADDYMPGSGSWSGWPARAGANGLDPEFNNYPDNTDSWMIYGPFDLSGASDAYVSFNYWNLSEVNYDYLVWFASVDGLNFYGNGTTGDSGGWQSESFDLTNVYTLGDLRGQPQVWIAFYFTSDFIVNDKGAFLDDINIWKFQADGQNLTYFIPPGWYGPIVPSSVSGTHSLDALYAGQPTYVDWSAINNGTVDIPGTFHSCLYLDSVEQGCWYTEGLLASDYAFVEDYPVVVATEGWHELKVVIDAYNEVTEILETDNEWSESFYWSGSGGPNCDALLAAFDKKLGGTTVHNPDGSLPTLMPPHPDLLERFQRGEVQLPSVITDAAQAAARGIDQPSGISRAPAGQWRGLALLVEFTDNPSAVGAAYFDTLLFGTGSGTLKDYYDEISYGVLDIVTVTLPSTIGWCTLPQTYAYYVNNQYGFGSYPQDARKMAEDAVLLVDPVVDFSQYDNDSDGWVDTVFVIHAGPGAEMTGSTADIWSHSWNTLNDPVVDGVMVNSYTSEPEYWLSPGDMTVGVYAHELGHVYGLPDLYDTDYSSSGIGEWSLMAGGSWNGALGNSPAHPDAWSRYQLGWLAPTNVTADTMSVSIPAVENTASAYRLWTTGLIGNEYFLVENRQQTGYDAALPGSGLLIYHVDESVFDNDNECAQPNNWLCGYDHPIVAVEQADGLFQLETGGSSEPGDPYPGTAVNRNFSVATLPNSSSYTGPLSTLVSVTNISNSSMSMTADLLVGLPAVTPPPVADFDGDGDTDISYFRPSNGRWYVVGQPSVAFGASGDIPVPADYDGDGDTDMAYFRPSNGRWNVLGQSAVAFGASGDIPVPADYDGDGNAELAYYRPSNGRWYILGQSSVAFGISGAIPVPADYDGDGDEDLAYFRPSNNRWYVLGQPSVAFGASGAIPVPADYDGDGDTDLAYFRPSNNRWYVLGNLSVAYGVSGAIPVPGDYDGDGDTDIAYFRPSNGRWYVLGKPSVAYGASGDFPLPVRDTNGDGDPYQ